jgi:hypothetical protein
LRNGYEPGRIRTAEDAIGVQVPQVRGAVEPFRSTLMGFLEGNSDVLERLVTEMYARGHFRDGKISEIWYQPLAPGRRRSLVR